MTSLMLGYFFVHSHRSFRMIEVRVWAKVNEKWLLRSIFDFGNQTNSPEFDNKA